MSILCDIYADMLISGSFPLLPGPSLVAMLHDLEDKNIIKKHICAKIQNLFNCVLVFPLQLLIFPLIGFLRVYTVIY